MTSSRRVPVPRSSARRSLRTLLMPAALAAASFVLYAATAAPSVAVLFDDTLEFQVVVPTLGIAHPSGYPLYTLLGKLFTLLVPVRDPAGRLNLFSAAAAALAVAVYYLAVRRWARSRLLAAAAATAFAISPIWWSQATLAEVYALHGLLVALFLYFLVRWEDAVRPGVAPGGAAPGDGWLAALALVTGLGLAHHRTIALLVPPALLFLVWTDPGLLRSPRRWWRPLLCALAPLFLYLYLPLRGQAVSSLDGTYVPTAAGTVNWILARAYGVFFTGNPFNIHRDLAYFWDLFAAQFSGLLFFAAGLGLITAWRLSLRRYAFLLLASLIQAAFIASYKVQDIEVFCLPAVMLLGIWAALGLLPVLDMASIYLAAAARGLRLSPAARPLVLAAAGAAVLLVLLAGPVQAARQAFPSLDRSHVWSVYDRGQDMVESAAAGGQIVGLGGEVTLVRYFRDVLGQRPDLDTVRADAEPARYEAIAAALARGTPVYLTRDLPGVAGRYSLAAAGPLIRVLPKARPAAAPPGQEMGAGVRLVSSAAGVSQERGGPRVRLDVAWATTTPLSEPYKVSARLLDAEGKVIAADDSIPVHFAYPTTAWVPGEFIPDVYDLPLPYPRPAGPLRPLLILYRAADGSEIGRAELAPLP